MYLNFHTFLSRRWGEAYGTNWEDVRMTLDDFKVRIEVRGKRKEYGFAEMGFGNRQKNSDVPDAYWVVLKTFARFGGKINWQSEDILKTDKNKLKAQVSELRKRLKVFFGLTEDPFHPYTKARGYCTRFSLVAGDGLKFPMPDEAGWDDVTITLTADGQFCFEVETTRRSSCHVYDRDEDDARGGRREVVEEPGTVERVYDHRMLGLSLQNGEPDRRAKALTRVIKNAGRVKDPQTSDAMIELGGFLSLFFGVSEPSPFDYKPNHHNSSESHWVARFNTTR